MICCFLTYAIVMYASIICQFLETICFECKVVALISPITSLLWVVFPTEKTVKPSSLMLCSCHCVKSQHSDCTKELGSLINK